MRFASTVAWWELMLNLKFQIVRYYFSASSVLQLLFVVDQMQVAQLAEVEQDTADLTIIICPTDQQPTYYSQVYKHTILSFCHENKKRIFN